MDIVESEDPTARNRRSATRGRMTGLLVVLALLVAACTPAQPPTAPTGTTVPATGAPSSSSGPGSTPSISVNDQELLNGTVTIAEVVSAGPGWVTVHAETNGGGPGAILGHTAVVTGTNTDVVVSIDLLNATQTLYAELRVDAGGIGQFNYPVGVDVEATANGQPVQQSFKLQVATGEVGVAMQNIQFIPTDVAIGPGTTVTWTNMDDVQHSATSDTGIWDSGLLGKGQTYSQTFPDPGIYPYYCTIHGGPGGEGMSGRVIVIPPGPEG